MTPSLTPAQTDAWVQSYEACGKLPETRIPCNRGCGTLTTMFGDNLRKRVAKFGGIRPLLETFACRACRRAGKPAPPALKEMRPAVQQTTGKTPPSLEPAQMDAWVQSYEACGKLPKTKIPCSRGCGTLTTMFGCNLSKRVAKFGGIRPLLETFACRACRRT